jgi:hypothetical protein
VTQAIGGTVPRIVVVSRRTEYQALIAHHGTRGQAEFFLRTRGRSIDDLVRADEAFSVAMSTVLGGIPVEWRRARVDREDLDRFLFEPPDVVVAVGQDGLVANTAKYLAGQIVVGVNPDPSRYEGVLVPHRPDAAPALLARAVRAEGAIEERTMVEAVLDDGQRLLALNEVFVGHQSHQSARYTIGFAGASERQSSSGMIVSTGTGATGWGRSVSLERKSTIDMPEPAEVALAFFVREAWPSVAYGATITEGRLEGSASLDVTSEMNVGGVVFGDGIEGDRLEFSWGRHLAVRIATERLRLIR